MSYELLWLSALIIYVIFYTWYVGFKGPLSKEEVESYMAKAAQLGLKEDDIETLRTFGLHDDGKDFLMMNNITFAPKPTDPNALNPVEVMANYAKPFMKLILRYAGHPVMMGTALSRSIETWGIDEESVSKWSVAGLVRYRSRRDIFEIMVSPIFGASHGFKKQALIKSFAYPVRNATGFLSVPICVALAVSNITAFLHIALF